MADEPKPTNEPQPVNQPVENPLGPEPESPPEPDQSSVIRAELNARDAQVSQAIQNLNARIAELAARKANSADEEVVDDTTKELRELRKQVSALTEADARREARTKQLEQLAQARAMIAETGMIVDALNFKYEFTSKDKHAKIAARIKREVSEEIGRMAMTNIRDPNLKQETVHRLWHQKVSEYRDLLGPIYGPAETAAQVADQTKTNTQTLPAVGSGASPGASAPVAYAGLDDPKYWNDVRSGLKQSLANRVAARQSGRV